MWAFGMGYRGKKVEHLLDMMDTLDADVMDVRFMPFGRTDWGYHALKERLGSRYVWNKKWGNEDYKGDTVRIHDFEGGLEVATARREDLILLCVCPRPEQCHRAVLLSELGKRGWRTQDIDAIPPPLDDLFSSG